MTQLFSLIGRVAVINGASGAIGAAIARGYAEAGADLALTYNSNVSATEALAEELRNLGVKVIVDQVNVQSEQALRDHAAKVQVHFGSTRWMMAAPK